MKKIIKTMLVIVGVLAMTSACSKSGQSTNNTFDKITKVNDGYQLLDKYEAIQYTMKYAGDNEGNTCTLTKNGDGPVLAFSKGGATTVYCSHGCYKDEPEQIPEYTVGWFMPKKYDSLMDENVKSFLVSSTDGENILSEEKDGDNTIITTKSKEDNSEYHYKYTVNTKSYEIQKFEVYDVTDGKESLLATSEISYNTNYQIPEFVNTLMHPEFPRTLEVIVDPGKSTEKTYKTQIPNTAKLKTYLDDSYSLYNDKEGTTVYDSEAEKVAEGGSYPDRVVYCIKK